MSPSGNLPLFIATCFATAILGVTADAVSPAPAARPEPVILETVDVAPVWSGHPVGFCLVTRGDAQYVAFYDKDRRMTVAKRRLGSTDWHFSPLQAAQSAAAPVARDPAVVGWDSHNYVTMAFDAEGQLHVSGNMHVNPLVYFRTTRQGDIDTLTQVPNMLGDREDHCTYPRFIDGPAHELIFAYRDGRSGNGADVYNRYDPVTHVWSRLLDAPLTDGLGRMNAYCRGPVRGPDGLFHLCCVWRDSGDCASNHDLSYARSKDLIHWERSDGKPLALPITLESGEIVDAVPPKGGIINGNTLIGFDSEKRVILSYHKYDAQGNTQIYNARREKEGWRIVRASQWSYRWDFAGGGTINFEIGLSAVSALGKGRLVQTWRHSQYGSGGWILDERTLEVGGPYLAPPSLPGALQRVESKIADMRVKLAEDLGRNDRDGGPRYVLRWETLPANRDRPPARGVPLPPPSMLRVYLISASQPLPAAAP